VTVLSGLSTGDPPGATPLDDEDFAGLIPTWIATRGDLNTAEQDNIAAAMVWAFNVRRRWDASRLLSRAAMADLHVRMFGEVWRWAGTWRRRVTNIGTTPSLIVTELENLLGDVRAQTAERARLAWSADELAVRFHHRLVQIHPFPNGNGRHARLAADLLVTALDRPRFNWGAGRDLTAPTLARDAYLAGLRRADSDFDYSLLLKFARS
jgi:Fic-DOC domain mobile mystery protein B